MTDNGLKLELVFNKQEFLYAESIHFSATLVNVLSQPIGVTTFEPDNRCLVITLKRSDGSESRADQLSSAQRDGLNIYNPPRDPYGTMLEPGQSLSLSGDLLTWFGYIAPGAYTVTADYHGIMRVVSTPSMELNIYPAAIQSATTPRWGHQAGETPFTAAWVHKHGDSAMLFLAQQSPYLPRNPRRGIRTALAPLDVSVRAACLADQRHPVGHLYWFDKKQRLAMAPVDLTNGAALPPVAVKKVPRGEPLESALSLPDGSMLLPYADPKTFSLLHLAPDGKSEAHELDLGQNAPVGPYACFWEQDLRLHFAWTKTRGRQIDYAMLPLDDPASGFARRTVYISNDPVIWMDAYLSRTLPATQAGSLYLGDDDTEPEPVDPPLPEVMLWCVCEQAGRYLCVPVNASTGGAMAPVVLQSGGLTGLRVISSVVTSEYGLALLMADAGGKLYYGSTMRKSIQPLEALIHMQIHSGDFPALMKGGDRALEPWVHLRFVFGGQSFQYLRLEPEHEPDPFEKETQAWEVEPDEEIDEYDQT